MTTNAWAFLHWLRTTRSIDLVDWATLQRWSADQPNAFATAVCNFAGGGQCPPRLAAGSQGEGALAELLLFADLRPDDRLLVNGPWIVGDSSEVAAAALLETAVSRRATLLVAPATVLAAVAFRRACRCDLSPLRTIIATGGPMSPEARRRVYTWVKADIVLLARSGDTFWGNPLEPVLAQPPATPAFLTGGRHNPPPTLQALHSR